MLSSEEFVGIVSGTFPSADVETIIRPKEDYPKGDRWIGTIYKATLTSTLDSDEVHYIEVNNKGEWVYTYDSISGVGNSLTEALKDYSHSLSLSPEAYWRKCQPKGPTLLESLREFIDDIVFNLTV